MNITLKRKYRPYGRTPEPARAKGQSWKGNARQWGKSPSGNAGQAGNKHGEHPIGFSGRLLGGMSRRYRAK